MLIPEPATKKKLTTAADRLKKQAKVTSVPTLLARPAAKTPAKKAAPAKKTVGREAPASSRSNVSNVSGDWSKVLLGGRGVDQTSGFWSSPGNTGRGGAHTGVDIGAPTGTPVHMPMDGVVVFAGNDGAFGNEVKVRLADGNYMVFGHLSTINVKVGQNVGAGQFVARTGNTGNSTGPHLHVEVRTAASKGSFGNRESWRFVDPIKYLNSNGKEAKPFTMDGSSNASVGGGAGSGGGGSTSVGGGGGGGGGSYGYSKKEMYQYLSANFGDIDTLFALDKELTTKGDEGRSLKWAIDQLVKKRITSPEIAYTYLNQTAFFKKFGSEVSTRLIEEKQRPGVANSSIEAAQATISQNMASAGIQLPPEELRRLARDAWVYGWNDQQINAQIAASSSTILGGGAWDATVNDVATYADEYGVGFSDAQYNQLKADYLSGRGTEALQKQIREQAASTYSVFADRINAGESTRAITDAYFRMAADLLEVDQNSIEWDDPLFKNGKAFTSTDPTTGQPAVKNLADFERDLKQDNRWVSTKNARDELTNGAYNIMARMGVVS